MENVGLTSAAGGEIQFYSCRNGEERELLSTVSFDESFPVNTAKKTVFQWTVPSEGADGYCIKAVAREKAAGGGYYDAVECFSQTFQAAPEYTLTMDRCVQNGDSFDVRFTVKNSGNRSVPSGAKAKLCLEGLYGDLKEKYGMDDEVLVSTEAVRWAAEKEIVTGFSAEEFGPNNQLTREQLATILRRFAKQKDVETAHGEASPLDGFLDAADVSDWADPSVRWAVDAGIIQGIGGDQLAPMQNATRAQVATMLMRFNMDIVNES